MTTPPAPQAKKAYAKPTLTKGPSLAGITGQQTVVVSGTGSRIPTPD